jgi:hypothetical protein
MCGVGEASEVLTNGHDKRVERAADGFLPELAGSEPEDVASDGDSSHVLWVTSNQEAVRPGYLPGAVNDG